MAFADERPALVRQLSATQFLRWYWLKAELVDFARSAGLSVVGSKEMLSARIAAFLDGMELPPPEVQRRSNTPQLAEPLSRSTKIPPGQRSTQLLRHFFEREIGPGFRFDAAMRAFLSASQGERTLGEAISFFQFTRSQKTKPIDAQFELNRFTRAFYKQNPTASVTVLRAAWRRYRSLPVDVRGRA